MRYEYSIDAIYGDGDKETFFFWTKEEATDFKQAMQKFGWRFNIVSVREIVTLHPRNVYRAKVTWLE